MIGKCHSCFFFLQKEMKLSLTDPLTQLVGCCQIKDQAINVASDELEPDCELALCNTCVQCSKNLIFKRSGIDGTRRQWINLNCDALVRSHRFIRRNNISASEFVEKIHPSSTEPDEIYNVSNLLMVLFLNHILHVNPP